MTNIPDLHHRKSIRLQGYDYSQDGAYFITICAKNREHLFGKIITDGRGTTSCAPTEIGEIAMKCWHEIPKHYPSVILDEFVLMPNHIHGILFLSNKNVGAQDVVPVHGENRFHKIIPGSIGAIVRGYKIGVTKWYRENIVPVQNIENQKMILQQIWQRNYYEHIIRNEKSLYAIREYIINNPLNWEKDELFEK